jgi:hypothetical protein
MNVKMECPLCMLPVDPMYTINCGSKQVSEVDHTICHPCEINLRLTMKPTRLGRILICPFCRLPEPSPGNRSAESFQRELTTLYEQYDDRVHGHHIVRDRRPVRAPVEWCKNREMNQCATPLRTSRKCAYPPGCPNHVCNACNVCNFHFDF